MVLQVIQLDIWSKYRIYREIYANNQDVVIVKYRLDINWDIEIVGGFKLK